MIAKIKTKNGIYNSIVFGFLGKGWGTKAIVMSEDNSKLEIIKFWDPNRRVFIIDASQEEWIKKHNFEGYDWIYKNLKKRLFNVSINSEGIIENCIEMQSQIKVDDWHLIKDKNDIKNLDEASLNFHDAYVENISTDDDKTIINFSAWDCSIVLELTGKVETNLNIDYGRGNVVGGYCDVITESNMFFENGFVYWVNSANVKTSKETFADNFNRYFKAQNIRWRIII